MSSNVPRATSCGGCGRTFFDDLPERVRCGDCPPQHCAECGEMDSVGAPCRCWVSLEGMPLADIKALFARDGGFALHHNIIGGDGAE